MAIQVSQLCFEAALPLFEEEAAAGGDASGSSLRGGCTRAFERLHERAITLSKHAGMPALMPTQPPTMPSTWRGDRRRSCALVRAPGTTLTLVAWNRARSELTVAHAGDSVALLVEGTAADGQATTPLPLQLEPASAPTLWLYNVVVQLYTCSEPTVALSLTHS